ncbi:MAG: hypothetical protein ABIV06_11345 [Thermoanaerobaculia bacterium]
MRYLGWLGVLVVVSGCRMLDSEARIGGGRSPDGSRVAVARERTPVGGALATESYTITVTPSGNKSAGVEVWRAGGVLPTAIFWIDDRTLEVLVYPESSSHFGTIRAARRDDLEVVTRVLRRGGKAALCDSDSMEIVPSQPL